MAGSVPARFLLKAVVVVITVLALLMMWTVHRDRGQRLATDIDPTAPLHGRVEGSASHISALLGSGMSNTQQRAAGQGEGEVDCEMCDQSFVLRPEEMLARLPSRRLGEETIPLFRHYTDHQPWPQLQPEITRPGQMPETVHYLWCGTGYFEFHHYLGMLSVLRLLRPVKVIFHHRAIPTLDKTMYNTWFLELKQSVPNLVLRPLEGSLDVSPCGSTVDNLRSALNFLQKDGGVYVTSNVVITGLPRHLDTRTLWSTFADGGGGRGDFGRGVMVAPHGFNDTEKEEFIRQMQAGAKENTTRKCVTPDKYELPREGGGGGGDGVGGGDHPTSLDIGCVFISDSHEHPSSPHYPKDIVEAQSPFAELSRWLHYGNRRLLTPTTIPGSIPRISHFIWFNRNADSSYELQFYQYVTVLSVLHVAGFQRVYVHGNKEFTGPWWERLKREENVTFSPIEIPETVYQQPVNNIEHKSDITRYYILYKYGGMYSDFEAMWTQRVPDWLLSYPTVANSDWVQNGLWPDNINNGVLLARPGAPWLKHMLAAQRYYVDNDFVFNSILMSYRTYERHPDQLFIYRHLQVMCYYQLCHPTWHEGFMRNIQNKAKTKPFDWRTETLNLHVTGPEPEKSLVSPSTLKTGTDIFAEVGRYILQKSGKEMLLR